MGERVAAKAAAVKVVAAMVVVGWGAEARAEVVTDEETAVVTEAEVTEEEAMEAG